MLNTIISIFLIATLIVQITLIMYLLITTIKRDKEDKKFWDGLHKELEESNRKCLKLMKETYYPTWESEQNEDQK